MTLFEFIGRLKQRKIFYSLADVRDEAIMVTVVVPGQRWEVEFFSDGTTEVEVFVSNGTMYGQEKLDELFREFGD